MNKPTRPVLRWHGGKWLLAPWIIDHMPEHRVYVEPFGGAASVLMRKPRSYAEIYNDLDGDLVNLFEILRSDKGEKLVSNLELTPFSETEFKSAYEATDDPMERARRLVIRSFMGFGSAGASGQSTGFRANSNRSGTTPAHDWCNYPDCLRLVIDRMRGVVVQSRPALEVIRQHDGPETLHYVDPPYMPETRDRGSDYRFEMTVDDHRELLEFLRGVEGRVILSGYPTETYDQVLSGWRRVARKALADGARERTEVLWMNFEPDAQQSLFDQAGVA
ncbi:DNA adenine methylase [Ruegeria lacuscaerulensis]|uniref:DNA adenine methylase n=1 Tax=Ruegeria lacuscaerulensis TaxID=55218 RepID=UPI00147C238C|nr:DNA adenine methylase [Ruegeria lacuscaerulensis]